MFDQKSNSIPAHNAPNRNSFIRCALYDRVSTDMQVREGLSLDAQRQALTDYALSHGYTIAGYYTDEGITARKKMQNRKGLIQLLKDVEADKIDLILVTKLDRWFRNIKDYHNTQAVLEAHNCNWKTIFEEYDTSTANGRFAINIMLSVNENECDRDSDRIRSVFEYKKMNREHLNGKPAYGYISKNKKLIKDPNTRHIVEDIYDRYFTTFSKKEVIRYITAKYGENSPTMYQINRILNSETYAGIMHGIEDYCEPYITKEQLLKIKKISDSKIIPHQVEPFLFSSMIKCPVCGKNMSGFVKRQKLKSGKISEYKRYRCGAKFTQFHNGACISESVVEEYLLQNVSRILEERTLSLKQKQKVLPQKNNTHNLKQELERLNLLFLKGRIKEAYYEEQYASLTEKIKDLEEDSIIITLNAYKSISETLSGDWKSLYASLDAAHKKSFWKEIIQEINVHPISHKVCDFQFMV